MGNPNGGYQNHEAQGPRLPLPEVYDSRPLEGNMQWRPDSYDINPTHMTMPLPEVGTWSGTVAPASSSFVPYRGPPQYSIASTFPSSASPPPPLQPPPSSESDQRCPTTHSLVGAYSRPTSSSLPKSRAMPTGSVAKTGHQQAGTPILKTPPQSVQWSRTSNTHAPSPVSAIPWQASQSRPTYPPTSYLPPESSFPGPQGHSEYYGPSQPPSVHTTAHAQPSPTYRHPQHELPPPDRPTTVAPSRWASFKQALSHLREACCCA